VKEAAIGGMAQIQLGNLARDKASSNDVKQFGERMAADHARAGDELKQLAQQKKITLPTDLDAQHKATVDRLSKLSGAEFDKAYMKEVLSGHKHDVSVFKKESTAAKDADVKSFASRTLPTLQDHRKLAENTATKIGLPPSAKSRKGL
jgi:putative membrane protein